MRSGRGRSKKYAVVASRTFVRNWSHVSASVKMFSVRHSAQYPPAASWTTSNTSSGIRFMIRHESGPGGSVPGRDSLRAIDNEHLHLAPAILKSESQLVA